MHRYARIATALLLAAAAGSAAAAAGRAERRAAFEQVAVAQFRIEPQAYPGAPERPHEAVILRLLAEEATARAERTLLKQHLAGRVVRVASPGDARGIPLLTGTVRLPVSLPPGHAGGRAMFRKGPFATATVILHGGGKTREESVTLDWRDIRWVRGARVRRARKLDDVLVDFTRKAVDHAVKRLKRGNVSRSGDSASNWSMVLPGGCA